ncbi:uncharacterized protein ARMOST_12893 [Armillaria ostoyae]|uniref:Uncharacterized protein n=1 Tax=Armillaria ostoyae TaxID=47428 RepID=A0A284RLD6_ARMOS|nr:uncharacterized protein ARMOST_12893 [Armillaria ostoyae]
MVLFKVATHTASPTFVQRDPRLRSGGVTKHWTLLRCSRASGAIAKPYTLSTTSEAEKAELRKTTSEPDFRRTLAISSSYTLDRYTTIWVLLDLKLSLHYRVEGTYDNVGETGFHNDPRRILHRVLFSGDLLKDYILRMTCYVMRAFVELQVPLLHQDEKLRPRGAVTFSFGGYFTVTG